MQTSFEQARGGTWQGRRAAVAQALVRVGRGYKERGWTTRAARSFQEALWWDPSCALATLELRLVTFAGKPTEWVRST